MAILKAGSTVDGSPILTDATLGTTVYTKTEVDAIVDADVAVVDAKIDSEIAALPNTYYTETEIDTFLDGIGGLNSIPVNVIGDAATNQTLNVSTYSVFQLRPTADITLSTSNLPAAKRSISYIHLLDGGEQTLTFGPEISWDGGSVPTFSNKVEGAGYYIEGMSSTGISTLVTEPVSNVRSLYFKSDGTKMYVLGYSGSAYLVYQYSLSTAWDVSTKSYDSVTYTCQETATTRDITFSTDGTKLYEVGTGSNKIYQSTLSTPWDLSTASYDIVSLDTTSLWGTSDPYAIDFKPDGTKIYILTPSSGTIYEVAISTPWDLSTASGTYSSSLGTALSSQSALLFNDDGSLMYKGTDQSDGILKYSLSTAWDLSTASYTGIFTAFPDSMSYFDSVWGDSGKKMYVLDTTGPTIYQYSTTAPVVGQYNLDIISLSQFSTDQVVAKLETSGVEVSV